MKNKDMERGLENHRGRERGREKMRETNEKKMKMKKED